ncbi:sensor histidine kinase [Amycolatopsis anabasis]|uniref:sensor histidine kinase n=1 Tax=Amycolatopsis anabasis TaxID=1840409 RepID=UPI001FE55447|nr:sensor histidine kinase [Amycolatopsis anabasis]
MRTAELAGFLPGMGPEIRDPRAVRIAARLLAGAGLALLITCTVVSATTGDRPGTIAVAAVAAGWVTGMLWVLPRRARYPALPVLYFLGVLVLSTILVTRDASFTAFASIGYPFAFALFPARWSVFAVAATAIVPLLARTGLGTSTESPVWVSLVSVAGPLLYAAWALGRESERRRRANDELAETNTKLESALEENAGLHAQLLTQAREAGVLDERQRMAREIHDTLAQGLTGIVTQLEAAGQVSGDPAQQRRLDQVRTLARDSLREARRSVEALRPEPLAESRLPDALAELGRTWSAGSGVPVRVHTTGEVRPLLPELEVALFRVAQESLANAGKHARATTIDLTLSYLDDLVLLDVRDDGVGFTPDGPAAPHEHGNGFGLQAMKQRVHRVAGTLTVESAPGDGTVISARVPAITADTGGDLG